MLTRVCASATDSTNLHGPIEPSSATDSTDLHGSIAPSSATDSTDLHGSITPSSATDLTAIHRARALSYQAYPRNPCDPVAERSVLSVAEERARSVAI